GPPAAEVAGGCFSSHPSDGPTSVKYTPRGIFLFWAPLASTWLMMALEGPFLAAVIARLLDAKFNLAAYGVATAFAMLVEAPIIMLMSASTALVEDARSYARLRNFAYALNAFATGLLVLVLVPPVFDVIMERLIGLPHDIARLTYGALWFFLPWPGAIGYRRFLHGLLIRAGRTRQVAVGTVMRLLAMSGCALALAVATDLPGAWVGAAALSTGVVVEALATRWMAAPRVRELLCTPASSGADDAMGYTDIARFYYPLALTSLLGLTVQPTLTFFMGRAALPIESLAVFPVVGGLSFLFRAFALSYQDAAIALLGRNNEHAAPVFRFAWGLALATTGALALVTFTPAVHVWFGTISGLSPDLAALAVTPARVLVPLPALSVLLSVLRAVMVQARRT
ncbi:MAG: hypothetical protein D6701_01825, partial [Gemmatimonadetes bacterium]